jgi:two-component system cell cycle response regulator
MTDGDTNFGQTVFGQPKKEALQGNVPRLPVLVVLRGAQVGRRYLLNESGLVLGRRPDRAALVVPGDAQISSTHCRFERGAAPETWQVTDLASTNGTIVGETRITTSALRDGDRILVGETVLKFTFHDELEEEFHRQVDNLMNIDELTGLPVQRVYQTRFADALMQCKMHQRALGVFMMDMDGLKKINDTHGHLVGAHTIATVGRRLGAIVHEARGTVSRFGGDEFSAFVVGADKNACRELGERLRKAVAEQPITRGNVTVNPTISIGFAAFPDNGLAPEQLTRQADEALYRAKAAGRNCVCE